MAHFITRRITIDTKRIDLFLGLTDRFHTLLFEIHRLNKKVERKRRAEPAYQLTDFDKADAHELYRQFFGLMYDEFFAYRRGFLDEDLFQEWMVWRLYDRNFQIGGVSYEDGWTHWKQGQSPFTDFFERIHRCRTEAQIYDTVRAYHPFGRRPQRERLAPLMVFSFLCGVGVISVAEAILARH